MARKPNLHNAARGIIAAFALLGMASISHAAITTFATFFERVGGADFVFVNNSPTNATFNATSPIFFSYLNIPGLPADLQGIQSAHITIVETTTAPATLTGGSVAQPFPVIATTITITRDTPAAEGFGTKTILLQVTNSATLDGLNGSTSGSLNAATSTGETVVFTSDFLNFSNTIARDLAIALTQINPPLGLSGPSGAAGTFLNSFTAVASGNFSSDPVPNASTPTIAKSFSPNPILAGGVSTLTFTLSNANIAAVTNVSFIDTYPALLFNATPSNVVNTCGGTVSGGVAGGNTIGLSGVTIAGNSSCTISVNVTSALVNCYNNVSSVVNSDQGPGNTAVDTLCVTAALPALTTQSSANITLGGTISDTATLSGGVNPTGTITFSLYGPNDLTCASPAIFTSTVTVSGNGNYTSASFTPGLVGGYRWIANYTGDANNGPVTNLCNTANENVVVTQATPAVVTTASAAVALGGAIHDTAVLSGGFLPTGTITFNLYGPNDATCSGAVIFSSTVTVAGNGSYLSASFTPTTAGTYRWIANYSGDAGNAATLNACNAANESVVVNKTTPTVTTAASASVTLGGPISDSATLSGGTTPTGTITFNLYGPNDTTCSGAVIFSSTVAVGGNGVYPSGSFTPTVPGTYRWIANYSGDVNNNATANACNAANENVIVTQNVTTVTTQASPAVTLGASISDTATLSGGANPTGTMTFNLYGPNDATCSGAVIFSSTIAVNGNGNYVSASFTPTTAGTYRWIANYSGDINNTATANACNAANENVVVAKLTTALTTQASAAVAFGAAISDTATLSGGTIPTGTITFNLFGPNDATCTGAVVFTSTVPVNGNGNYVSGSFTPTTAGTYRWIANYSGDANNTGTANTCNAANENVVVSQATPTVVTTASSGVSLGATISDSAVLAGGVNPTGSILFRLYGPNDATCTGAIIFTSTIPVAGNGTYGSGNFTPTSVGTYRWIANYSGDANNAATANTCNAANENVVVTQAIPAVFTTASAGVQLGAAINDSAVLAGGGNPTGSMLFRLYGPNDATCTGAIAFTATIPVAGNGTYGSGNFTPTLAGTYRWIANYTGDANNAATANACNAANESVVVTQATPTVVTGASPTVLLGGAIHDGATLSGGINPTGTLIFNLYGPNDATCSGAVIFSTTISVVGNAIYGGAPFTPTTAGTYRWIANYSGDANNAATANACNAANENVVVTQAAPTVITTASATVPLGGVISDSAVLAAGANPTGSILFRLYGPNDATCTGAIIFTSTIPVAGNGTYGSGNFTPTVVGTYRWIANYSGDTNNAATANACNGANENVAVGLTAPTVVTTASAAVPLGGAISDNAVLAGGVNATGSILFRLYGPNDAACTGLVIFTSTVPVAGNGTYPSASFTPSLSGTYRWIANYSGDAGNGFTANACNAANESVVVAQATPTVVTTASAGVPLGAAISDSAVLAGGVNPTGSILFRLYGPNDATCSGAIIFTSTIPVSGNGSYGSGNFTPASVGTYRWIANYSGDASNAATANACNGANESVVVSPAAPNVATNASPSVPLLGGSISDTATLSGAANPTGTITFNLYGPNDATCANAAIFSSTVTVNGNGMYPSTSFTPSSIGTYRWIANYSGDTNNVATLNTCNGANENVVVTVPSVITPVPTISDAMLLLLTMLLGMSGLVAARRGSRKRNGRLS